MCRSLAQLFRENNIDYENVNYFTGEFTEEKLRQLLRKANLSPFEILRTKEPLVKELNITKETSPDKIIKLIVENPGILQRLIVEVGEQAVLASPIEKAIDLINQAK